MTKLPLIVTLPSTVRSPPVVTSLVDIPEYKLIFLFRESMLIAVSATTPRLTNKFKALFDAMLVNSTSPLLTLNCA